MRDAEFNYRAHAKFTSGCGDTEIVMKSCILAFPSLWASCNIVF